MDTLTQLDRIRVSHPAPPAAGSVGSAEESMGREFGDYLRKPPPPRDNLALAVWLVFVVVCFAWVLQVVAR
mgnify:CR=1 FL=1